MKWIKLGKASCGGGLFFSWKRVYWGTSWTPFISLRKRYSSWLGFWNVGEKQ